MNELRTLSLPCLLLFLSAIPTPAENTRVVDYGDDYAWYGMSAGAYGQGEKWQYKHLDLDGDGKEDDSAIWKPFRMDGQPWNPPRWSWDYEANSAIFWGGGVGYLYNRKDKKLKEGGINKDHFGLDDLNWHANYITAPGEAVRMYFTVLWRKEEFLNEGDKFPVSLDAESRMALRITRMWIDYDEGRFLVRQKGTFYISEHAFGNLKEKNNFKVYELSPTQTRWAVYKPEAFSNPEKPWALDFDPARLEFKEQKFSDVDAFGFIIAKHGVTKGNCWLKWAGFGVDANVSRPDKLSHYTEMATLPGGLSMGKTEVDYALWTRIYNWGVRNQFTLTPGYMMIKDGDIGSMDADDVPHSTDEPVTDITFLDALAWCNMLSEREGREPVYYMDSDFKQVYRQAMERRFPDKYKWKPKVFAKWSANGYRLPTRSEWETAAKAGSSSPSDPTAWTASNSENHTHATGKKKADSLGLHDMMGNVWEYVWDISGNVYDPDKHRNITVMGGDFRHPSDPSASALLPYGEIPGNGHPAIGFRLVRGTPPSNTETAPLTPGYQAAPFPSWTFAAEQAIPGTAKEITKPPLDMLDIKDGTFTRTRDESPIHISAHQAYRTEVPYKLWREVYNWAVMNGYDFDHDGDMGSMERAKPGTTFQSSEPVTEIDFNDMLIWCNALSEMCGYEPVYHLPAEEEGQPPQVARTNIKHRIFQVETEKADMVNHTLKQYTTKLILEPKWSADGFRLPTANEWEFLARGGAQGEAIYPYPPDAGINFTDPSTDYIWMSENSGYRTHPVGKLKPNGFGLYDMSGNVWEMCWGLQQYDYYDKKNPKGNGFPSQHGGSYKIPEKKAHGYLVLDEKYSLLNWETGLNCAFDELGFRIVRFEKDVLKDSKQIEYDVVLDALEEGPIDPMQNRMWRGNIQRTGLLTGEPIRTQPKEIWRATTGGKNNQSSPIVVDGTLYIGGADGKFYAMDAATGRVKWTHQAQGPVYSSAAVDHKNRVYYLDTAHNLYALNTETGEKIWQIEADDKWRKDPGCSPLVINDTYVLSQFGRYFQGFEAQTGKPVWQYRLGGAFQLVGLASGAVGSDVVVMPFWSMRYGMADLRHEYSLGRLNTMHDEMSQTPVIDEETGTIYGYASAWRKDASGKGHARLGVAAYKVGYYKKGKEGELFESLWDVCDDWKIGNLHTFTSLAMDEKNLYLGAYNKHVYAFKKNRKTGKNGDGDTFAWKTQVDGFMNGSPTIVGDVLYIGTLEGTLYALNTGNGKELWKINLGSPIRSSVWVDQQTLYVSTEDGSVIALK